MLLKQFNETGEEIGSEDVPVTPDNFPQLVEQYGPEFAKGYAYAVADIEKRIHKDILLEPGNFNSPNVAGRKLLRFWHRELKPLLNTVIQFLPNSKNTEEPGPQ